MATGSDYSNFSMLDLFRTEVSEQGRTLTDGLLALESDPTAADKLESLMRASHSIKGAARMVGVDAVVQLAHVVEDVFVAAQEAKLKLESSHVDTLLQVVDRIISISQLSEKELMGWAGQHKDELKGLINDIDAIKSGEKHESHAAESKTEKPAKPVKKSKPEKTKPVGRSRKKSQSGEKPVEKPVMKSRSPDPDKKEAKTPSRPSVSQDQPAPEPTSVVAEPIDVEKDRVLRVTAERWNQMMGLAGEVKVEAGWLHPYVLSLSALKRRQIELAEILDSMRAAIDSAGAQRSVTEMLLNAQKKISECRSMLADQTTRLDAYDRKINTLSEKLHRETIKTRMRPFSDGVQGFQRMVRDISKSLGKKVRLEINGLSVQVDRDVLEKMEAPMNHILRNALDHGVETPAARIKAGKPEQATIKITAVHIEGMLSIKIEDDGSGIDLERLREKVIQKKLVTREMGKKLSEKELLEFLYLPSFSTKEKVTDLSGRGVGLDVVLSTIQKLHGSVETVTRLGEGTCFHLRLPLTLSVISSLIVEISGEPYAFPLTRITHAVKLPVHEINVMEDQQFARIGDDNIGLVGASQVLGLDSPVPKGDELSIIIIGDRNNRCGIVVDRFIGQKELAIQTLDPRLGKVQDISAAAILEDGSPVLIMDVDDLVLSVDSLIRKGRIVKVTRSEDEASDQVIKHILVVDDSLTVREVERNLLENAGYHVDVAVDGVDGWNAIRKFRKYDLILTDIDMPRMDGFELVRMIKSDKKFSSIPVIIVSYKEREADRKRGMEAGADFYLTKGSFHDKSLLDAVADLIGEVEV